MNNISPQAAHPGVLFKSEPADLAPQSLCAGDIVVFDGTALHVVSGGSMPLSTGPVEVAHVQASPLPLSTDERPDLRAAHNLTLPPALARKLAEYIGATQGQPYQVGRGEVELIERSRKTLETFQEADRFMAKLFG